MKIKVEAKISVTIGDKTLKLTREEANNLRAALNDALGELPQTPYYPPVTWPEPSPVTCPAPAPPWTITCTTYTDKTIPTNDT